MARPVQLSMAVDTGGVDHLGSTEQSVIIDHPRRGWTVLQGEWLGLGLCRVLGLRRLARNGATVEGLAKRTGRTPDFIERALSWDAGSVSRWPVGSFGDFAPRGAQMSPRLDLRR